MCAADDVASAAESDPINALCTCAAGVSLSGPNCWCCELPTNPDCLLPHLRYVPVVVAAAASTATA